MADKLNDITATAGKKLVSFLTTNRIVTKLAFPSVNHVSRKSWAYRASDYLAIAGCIGVGKVQVYSSKIDARAQYCNVTPTAKNPKAGDFFVLSPSVAANLDGFLDVLLHEATHMVQDFKRLKLSRLEAEIDAHFAQALFLVHANLQHLAKSETLPSFMTAAKAYNEDAKYFNSRDFRQQRSRMRSAVISSYIGQDLNTKSRLDGITL